VTGCAKRKYANEYRQVNMILVVQFSVTQDTKYVTLIVLYSDFNVNNQRMMF
jgi:hypothetical protein